MAFEYPNYPPGTPIYYQGHGPEHSRLPGIVTRVDPHNVWARFSGSDREQFSPRVRTFCDVPEFLYQPLKGKAYIYIDINTNLPAISLEKPDDSLEIIAIKEWRI